MLVAFGANRSLQPTHLTAHIFIHCYFKNAPEIRDVPFHQLGLLGSPLGCTICPSFLWVCHRHRCVITSCCWFASKAPPFRSGDGGRLGFSMPLVLRVKRLWGVYGADEHCTSPRGVLQSGRIWEIRSSASARNLFTFNGSDLPSCDEDGTPKNGRVGWQRHQSDLTVARHEGFCWGLPLPHCTSVLLQRFQRGWTATSLDSRAVKGVDRPCLACEDLVNKNLYTQHTQM